MFEGSVASSPPEIIGYVDPWIASPGSTVDVKVNHQKNNHKYVSHFLIRLKSSPLSLAYPVICFVAKVAATSCILK